MLEIEECARDLNDHLSPACKFGFTAVQCSEMCIQFMSRGHQQEMLIRTSYCGPSPAKEMLDGGG